MKAILETLSWRWSKAATAFSETLKVNSKRVIEKDVADEMSKIGTEGRVVGWLCGKAVLTLGSEPQIVRIPIYRGWNHLQKSEKGIFNRTELAQFESSEHSFYIDGGELRLLSKLESSGGSNFYHGDQISIFGFLFRIKILSARAFGQGNLIAGWLFMLFCVAASTMLAQAQNQTQESKPPIPIKIETRLSGVYRETVNTPIYLPGVYKLNKSDVHAVLKTDSQNIDLEVKSAQTEPMNLFIVVDSSQLCVQRNMQTIINVGIGRVLQRIHPDSRFTLMEYHRKEDGAELYSFLVKNKRSRGALENLSIQCNANSSSINGLASLFRLEPYFLEIESAVKNHPEVQARNVVVVISSGNLKDTEGLSLIIERYGLELYTYVYSPTGPSYLSEILGPYQSINRGQTLWWEPKADADTGFLAETLPILWDLDVKVAVPHDLPEMLYPLEFNFKKSTNPAIVAQGEMSFLQSPRNYFFYRLWLTFAIGFFIAAVIMSAFFVYKYYRVPRSKVTGQVMSRHWHGDLFASLGKNPVLYVTYAGNYDQAIVLKKPLDIVVGNRLGSDVRLKKAKETSSLRIRSRGYETYEVSEKKNDRHYILNGFHCLEPQFLRHGDCIQIGAYRIFFLFPHPKLMEMSRETKGPRLSVISRGLQARTVSGQPPENVQQGSV